MPLRPQECQYFIGLLLAHKGACEQAFFHTQSGFVPMSQSVVMVHKLGDPAPVTASHLGIYFEKILEVMMQGPFSIICGDHFLCG